MTMLGTIEISNSMKTCPKCGRLNLDISNYCDKCRFAFNSVNDDLSSQEKRDIKKFYANKKSHQQFKNAKSLIKDLND